MPFARTSATAVDSQRFPPSATALSSKASAPVYALRNRIKRCIKRLKNRRRVATRNNHTASSFLSFVQLAAISLWISFVHAT